MNYINFKLRLPYRLYIATDCFHMSTSFSFLLSFSQICVFFEINQKKYQICLKIITLDTCLFIINVSINKLVNYYHLIIAFNFI